MSDNLTYLDTYILQRDMRIRMPKSILKNLNAEKGKRARALFPFFAPYCSLGKTKACKNLIIWVYFYSHEIGS